MEHVKYDLGQVQAGATVVVTLNNRANVMLMTATNYRAYVAGRRVSYYGGEALRSPLRINVPHTDHWYVALNLGGAGGRIESTVSVEPPRRASLPSVG
ncbi:MAG: resistance protein [Marmoricola sp.]|nr:resistance protein [Marmoricola sp.]